MPTATATPAPTPEPMKWTAVATVPIGHNEQIAVQNWVDRVNDLAEGRLEVELIPGGAMFGMLEQIPQVMRGTVQIAPFLSLIHPELMPLLGVHGLPLANLPDSAVESPDQIGGMLESFAARIASGESWKTISDEMEQTIGLRILFPDPLVPSWVFTKEPVATIEDFDGLKLRTAGAAASFAIEALGGSAVVVPIGDTYTALQTGLVDGVVTGFQTMDAFNLAEPLSYVNMWPILPTGVYLWVINAGAYRALPEDLQQILDQAAEDLGYWDSDFQISWDGEGINEKASADKMLKATGGWLEMVPVDASVLEGARELMKPYYAEWANSIPDSLVGKGFDKAAEFFELVWGLDADEWLSE
jgi:TRAP-type C4-dicarboxylate transport system substrate-binding protein